MRAYIILLFILILGCSDTTPTTDEDARSDTDSFTEIDNETVDDSLDEQVDTRPDEDDEIPDADNDSDSDIVCLDLRIPENVIKTSFPFKDKDGKPTFCRPGCDTPTETDPQCVRNIWEWDNWEEYQVYLAAQKKDPNQTQERECYPWPCKLPDMKGYTEGLTSSCDRVLTAYGFSASGGTIWSHGMSGGVAGMELSHSGRLIEYHPEEDEFWGVGQKMGQTAFSNGRYITLVFDRIPTEERHHRAFVISVERKDGKYYYELIYDSKEHQASFTRPPFSGKEWVLLHVCETEREMCEVKYAKVGEWKWHSLGVGAVHEGNIVGDRLAFGADKAYYCDLSTFPSSPSDCTVLNREVSPGVLEKSAGSHIDVDNKNRVVFHNKDKYVYVVVDFSDIKNPVYKEYPTNDASTSIYPNKVKDKYLMYSKGTAAGLKGCWYRFDTQKTYCSEKPWSSYGDSDMMFGIFSGKWQLWKDGPETVIRDWECYCKEEGICPFEGSEPPKIDD